MERLRAFLSKNTIQYALKGAAFGFCFPIAAFFIVAHEHNVSFLNAFLDHHSYLLYVIDTAPFFLGLLAYFVGVKQDSIEELYKLKARKDLEEKNAQLHEAERIGRFGSWECHFLNSTVRWSDGLYAVLGLDPTHFEPSFDSYIQAVHPDDQSYVTKEISEAKTSGRPVRFQHRILLKEGDANKESASSASVRWLNTNIKIVTDEFGNPIKMIGTAQDITEKRSQEETIVGQQQALMASAKMSALGEMAGGVAHEINTPLAVIQMRSEQIMEDIEAGNLNQDLLKQALYSINETVSRIAKIVRGLRTFARDGRKDPMSKCSVRQIVDETFSLCREKFTVHGVEMRCDIKEDIHIYGRSTELSQALLNLLNNSYDAIENSNEKWVRIELEDRDGHIELSVVDSGKGIPSDVQTKLMQPFFTTKELGKGTGLGLSISRGIVESHGGKLFVDNQCQNTKFTISLPKHVATQEEIPSSTSSAA